MTNIEINACYLKEIIRSLVIFIEDLVYFLNYLKLLNKNPISKKVRD